MGKLANTTKTARYRNQYWKWGNDKKVKVIMEPPEIHVQSNTHIKIGFFYLFLVSIGWYSENFVVIFSASRICGSEIQQHKNFMISQCTSPYKCRYLEAYKGRQFSGTLSYGLEYDWMLNLDVALGLRKTRSYQLTTMYEHTKNYINPDFYIYLT